MDREDLFPEYEISDYLQDEWSSHPDFAQEVMKSVMYRRLVEDEYDVEDEFEAEWLLYQLTSEDEEDEPEWEEQFGDIAPVTGVRSYDYVNGNLQQEIAEVDLSLMDGRKVVSGRIPVLYDDVV